MTSEVQTATPARRPGREPGRAAVPAEPRSWEAAETAPSVAPRTVTLSMPGGRRVRLTTDRVRARPAVSPQLSFMLGQNAIALGVWGFLFPRAVNRLVGIGTAPEATRLLFGARELATGVTLASDPTRADALWARVAGDALDVAALAPLARADNPKRRNARLALGVVLAVTALDLIAAVRMTAVKRNCA